MLHSRRMATPSDEKAFPSDGAAIRRERIMVFYLQLGMSVMVRWFDGLMANDTLTIKQSNHESTLKTQFGKHIGK